MIAILKFLVTACAEGTEVYKKGFGEACCSVWGIQPCAGLLYSC